MKAAISDRELSWRRAKILIGTLVASGVLFAAVGAVAPISASALLLEEEGGGDVSSGWGGDYGDGYYGDDGSDFGGGSGSIGDGFGSDPGSGEGGGDGYIGDGYVGDGSGGGGGAVDDGPDPYVPIADDGVAGLPPVHYPPVSLAMGDLRNKDLARCAAIGRWYLWDALDSLKAGDLAGAIQLVNQAADEYNRCLPNVQPLQPGLMYRRQLDVAISKARANIARHRAAAAQQGRYTSSARR
jgi:hypothetical protein